MMLRSLLSVVILAAMSCMSLSLADASERQPNMIFIAVDDLNDWIGCMKGHPQARTPNIDRLAKRGVLFTNAYCASPLCMPSRTAIFNGRYPDRTGVYNNSHAAGVKALPNRIQLTVHLSASGYETLGTGKLYHSASRRLFDRSFNTEQRWSPFTRDQVRYTEDELPTKPSSNPRHVIGKGPGTRDWVLPLNGLPSERNPKSPEGESFDWGPVKVADQEMGDVRITDWAIERLSERRTKPFFLGVGYYRPHIPLFAPQRDFDAIAPEDEIKLPEIREDDLDDIGPLGRRFALDPITAGSHNLVAKNRQWKAAVRAYLACVAFVDRQVGRLLDALEASPHAEDTWIILWSDHGWCLGEKQHWGKWAGWRTASRVPLIVVPPARLKAARGKECGEPVSLLDLYPTVLNACGLPAREDLDGVSLLDLVKRPEQQTQRSVLTTFDPGNYALSNCRLRLIRYHTGEEELYDVGKDPNEWHNLVRDQASKADLAEMRTRLERLLAGIKERSVRPSAK